MVYYTPLFNRLGRPPLYTTNNQGAPKIKDLPILAPATRPFSQDDGCWTEGTAFQLYATFTEATPRVKWKTPKVKVKLTGSGQESHVYTYSCVYIHICTHINIYIYISTVYICISVYLYIHICIDAICYSYIVYQYVCIMP